jgi:hypothetical protein
MRKLSIPGLHSVYGCLALCFLSCAHPVSPSAVKPEEKPGTVSLSSPSCIVYRTRADYSANVPVMLSSDRSSIVSYPDVKDIYFNGKLSVPVRLADGFYLDNRGIGPGVAFLSYTYEEYSRLTATPPSEELMRRLLDKDPLREMYQCGQRSQYADAEQELNLLITSGKLGSCKRLK